MSTAPISTPLRSTPLRLGLIGFGTVGSSLAEVLALTHPEAARITHVFNRGIDRKRTHARARHLGSDVVWTEDVNELLANPAIDCIVELAGGLSPAGDWQRAALAAGKHVVTANKQLIASEGGSLFALAAEHGVELLYNAAVAGGVPVIPGMIHGLSGDRLTRISGILNGTCNFILSAMETGADYADILSQAQHAGYAEADPTADVDGFDARAKLCILARLALRAELRPEDVPTQSIRRVSAVDFAYAKELGCTIRQISQAQLAEDPHGSGTHPRKVRARVGPMLLSTSSPLAWSRGTQNMVVTSGRFGGDVVFSGHGAGGHPTAVAVLSDVLSLRPGASSGGSSETSSSSSSPGSAEGQVHTPHPVQPGIVSGDVLAPHYLRFIVRDRPGIVAAIAGTLSEFGINLDSILQHRGYPADRMAFVVTTEPCLHSTMTRAIDTMNAFDFLGEPVLSLQVLVADDPELD